MFSAIAAAFWHGKTDGNSCCWDGVLVAKLCFRRGAFASVVQSKENEQERREGRSENEGKQSKSKAKQSKKGKVKARGNIKQESEEKMCEGERVNSDNALLLLALVHLQTPDQVSLRLAVGVEAVSLEVRLEVLGGSKLVRHLEASNSLLTGLVTGDLGDVAN